jgi:hypothetical protein
MERLTNQSLGGYKEKGPALKQIGRFRGYFSVEAFRAQA